MEPIEIKRSITSLSANFSALIGTWISIIFFYDMASASVVGGIIASFLITPIVLFKWAKSIELKENEIIIKKLLWNITIKTCNIRNIKIKNNNIKLFLANHENFRIPTNGINATDFSKLKDFLSKIKVL